MKFVRQNDEHLIAKRGGLASEAKPKASRSQAISKSEIPVASQEDESFELTYSNEQLTDEQIETIWRAAPSRAGVKIIDSY